MLRVLVVDDDVPTVDYLVWLLGGRGYRVESAASGAAALACVPVFCPHVVISDLMMPGMSGLELLKALRGFALPLAIFVLLTGFGTVSAAVEAITEGADECLPKPVDPDKLLGLLRRYDQRRRQVSA